MSAATPTRRPRRVLMTADAVGGVWTYALELAAALAPAGVRVTLFVPGGGPSRAQAAEAAQLTNVEIVPSDLRLEWMDGGAADREATHVALRRLECERAPDIVHVNGYADAAAGFAAPVAVVAHSCVPTWWRACRGETAPPAWDDYRARLAAGLVAADAVVAPTAAHLAALVAEHGAPANAHVIHNGCDGRRHRPRRKRPVALAAGRFWDEAKNLAVLREAARYAACPIHLAGDGVADAVPGLRPLGRLAPGALAEAMAQAAVFVAPARYEPFGLAVLEAALAGCALVLSDIASQRELWEGAARFVPPDDPRAIAAAIDALAQDPARARAAGAAARARAAHYSAEAMGRRMLALYAELLAGHAGGHGAVHSVEAA